VAEFLPPTPSFRHALARTALFFSGIGSRANFIGAPPKYKLSIPKKSKFDNQN